MKLTLAHVPGTVVISDSNTDENKLEMRSCFCLLLKVDSSISKCKYPTIAFRFWTFEEVTSGSLEVFNHLKSHWV